MTNIRDFLLTHLRFFGQYWAKGKLTKLYSYEKGERVQLSFWPIYYKQNIKSIKNIVYFIINIHSLI